MNTVEYVAEAERLYKILNQRRPDPTIQKQYDTFHQKYEKYVAQSRELFTQKNDKGSYIIDIHNGDTVSVKQKNNQTIIQIESALFFKDKSVEHKNINLKITTDNDFTALKHSEIHEFIFDKDSKKGVFLFLDKDEQLQSLTFNFSQIECEVADPKPSKKLKI